MEQLLVKVREAAQALGISRVTAYALVARGELPAVRIGRAVRIPKTGLLAWIATRTSTTAEET